MLPPAAELQKILATYRDLHARAIRINAIRRRRCQRLSREASLDPDLLGIHPHNAMASFHYGTPWPGVDNDKVRLILKLQQTEFQPFHVASRYYQRAISICKPN